MGRATWAGTAPHYLRVLLAPCTALACWFAAAFVCPGTCPYDQALYCVVLSCVRRRCCLMEALHCTLKSRWRKERMRAAGEGGPARTCVSIHPTDGTADKQQTSERARRQDEQKQQKSKEAGGVAKDGMLQKWRGRWLHGWGTALQSQLPMAKRRREGKARLDQAPLISLSGGSAALLSAVASCQACTQKSACESVAEASHAPRHPSSTRRTEPCRAALLTCCCPQLR